MWIQKVIRLAPAARGCHLITAALCRELPELSTYEIGMAQFFLQHTSASLTINENADPDVRVDLEMAWNRICPETLPFTHTCEGPDDMPAHVKSSMMGCGLLVPIRQGRLALGTWQGIYLCEHRQRAESRSIVATLFGQTQRS